MLVFLPTVGVFPQELTIFCAHADNHIEKSESKRRVRSRLDGDVLVRLRGRSRANGVDGDEICPITARFGNEAPGVVARRQRIVAPHDNELGVSEVLGVHAGALSQSDPAAGFARDMTDRHQMLRSAECVP